jgi:hypothetical protein
MIGVVPPNIVWGGRVNKTNELLRLELFSIVLNSLFLVFILIVNKTINISLKVLLIKTILWIMSLVFLLNTLGNLFAKSSIETMIFTPITILLSFFSIYLAINYNKA